MVSRTRRRLLHGTAALLTGLAGCNRASRSDSSPGTPGDAEQVARDPESYALRSPTEEPPAWLPDEREGETTRDGTTGRPRDARPRALVASEETAARLRFADVEGADAARAFVSETDFDARTLYVESRPVEACRSPELCHVTWSTGEIDTQYGGDYRDADVPCEADATVAVSWLIRVPDVLDPDAVSSYGSGWSSSGCRPPRRDREAGTTTEAPHLGPATNATATEDAPTSEGER
ncbi:hypothetical protein [Halorussus halobius]|uniref:hypothetical protein n=1 Tax=Halorussus halobius TaxID=1710537 RepID=UPI001092F84A|nr:hypothetical protein [Halorussus halobius]